MAINVTRFNGDALKSTMCLTEINRKHFNLLLLYGDYIARGRGFTDSIR